MAENKSEKSSQYKYTATLKLVTTKKTIDIPDEGIKYIIINYDYENLNMPMVFIHLSVSSKLYSSITKWKDKGKLLLNIKKYNSSSTTSTKTNYINSEFKYFMAQSEGNTSSELDTKDINKETADAAYKSLTIGLLDLSLLQKNINVVNGVYRNLNTVSMVYSVLKSFPKLVIEPFDYNTTLSSIIIPPVTSCAKLIEYLNKTKPFYKTGYRFFEDFDKTYLVSKRNTGIELKDGTYKNVIINISNKTVKNKDAQKIGIVKDKKKKLYTLYVDSANANLVINNTSEKKQNKIMSVTASGSVSDSKLNLGKTIDGERYTFKRLPNENNSYQSMVTSSYENDSVILSIRKNEIDSSIISLNRKYNVKVFTGYEKYQGDYILSTKKETLIRQGDDFMIEVLIGLRKVK